MLLVSTVVKNLMLRPRSRPAAHRRGTCGYLSTLADSGARFATLDSVRAYPPRSLQSRAGALRRTLGLPAASAAALIVALGPLSEASAADGQAATGIASRTAMITAVTSLLVALLTAVLAAWRDRRAQVKARELADSQAALQVRLAEQQHASQLELARLRDELDRYAKHEERLLNAAQELDRHREPLLLAALDLAHRINNIRSNYYLDTYLHADGHRARMALLSTLYRFGRYWCVQENLYNTVNLLRFDRDESTRDVSNALREVGRIFASDDYDSGQLMVWREEQRAVAELMLRDDGTPSIGFATFSRDYDGKFAAWLSGFAQELERVGATSTRLLLLQKALVDVIAKLDPRGTYADQLERVKEGL